MVCRVRMGLAVVSASSCLLLEGMSIDPPKAFLGGLGSSAMSLEELHRELIETDRGSLDAIERVLSPMYQSLPKNANGKIGHATVCYALHRYFVQEYGWFINGMAPDGSGWNGSSTTTLMEERTPAHVQGLLERHLGSGGLSLRELAALASVIHTLVSQQYLGRSEYAYRLAEAPVVGLATQQQFGKAIALWVAMLLIGPDMTLVTSEQIVISYTHMGEYFPNWDDLLFWVEDVRQSVAFMQRSSQNPFVGGALSLEAMNSVVAEVPKQFSRWHDTACADMKAKLVSLGSNGRVSLPAFYGGESPDEDWQFIESLDYLRQLGALDESDARRLRVIVPNYLIGPNNCLEASAMHTYCCRDECTDLMAEVERGVAAPSGSPGAIAEIVSVLASDTVDAPRSLPSELIGKLEAVAKRHGGRVPLHGRLFAQWMHHAFPNECPHPHVSGTTAPQTSVAYMRAGKNVSVSQEERAQHIKAQAPFQRLADGEAEDLAWSDEEELLSYDDPPCALWSLCFVALAGVFFLAGALSAASRIARPGAVTVLRTKSVSSASEKYVV